MSDSEIQSKRQKVESGTCVICSNVSPLNELTYPQDNASWCTLYVAASIRQFEPILRLTRDNPNQEAVPSVLYHRKCRSEFTHKKSLGKLKERKDELDISEELRHSARPGPSHSKERVYERKCIFCEKDTKYIKGTRTREALKPAVELRADKKIRDIAVSHSDERIIAITSRDIVAAEAHYHKTCYKNYTRQRPETFSSEFDEKEATYQQMEKAALQMVFEKIRDELFNKPRIVALAELTSQIVTHMNANGIREIRESTKTHVRRNLEQEFGDSLHFFSVDRKVHIRPDNFSWESIACELVRTKRKLEAQNECKSQENLINQTAKMIREQIKHEITEQNWPPRPHDLTSTYVNLPVSLMHFLNVLLGGKHDSSHRVSRLSWSIAQDFVTAVTLGNVLTPKQVLLPWAIKTLTGNVELIRTMNRLGHSCSYSKLEEIETALCIEKLEKTDPDNTPLPSTIHTSVATVLAFDNIDRQEEVLSGAGTSHRVNGIVVQPTSLTCEPPKQSSSVDKAKRRSIQESDQPLPVYTVQRRKSPPPIVPADLSIYFTDVAEMARRKNLLWVITRLHDTAEQRISAWTGFNILVRDNVEVSADTVGYLPTINAPATEMSTVQEILRQSCSIRLSLGLENISVVLDQALFAKATEIVWNNQDKYKNIVLMMGNFHTVCNLMSVIGKMFGDAGLRDLAVESGVIAEGSVSKVLQGKHCNRALRLHKLCYEALMRLAWTGFQEWLEKEHPDDMPRLEDTLSDVIDLHNEPCHTTHEASLNNESCKVTFRLFQTYLNVLRNDRGPMSKFWMTYLDLVEILLGLLRADREGDWYLHLYCIHLMIPWCFAMDKTNYARYLPFHFAQMTRLEETCPELHDHFLNGGFSVQLKHVNPFARIAVDQTTEETVNKDTQTAGGTRGFSLKPGAVSRYYLTAEHRAVVLRQLREQISSQGNTFSHPDIQKTRIQKDESDVSSLIDLLENDWINPFHEDPLDLVSVSTGAVAPKEVCSDLLSAKAKGEEAYEAFLEQRLKTGDGFYNTLSNLKLKTFSSMKQTLARGSNKEHVLKADQRVFGTMVLIAENRKLEMRDVFCHPLGPLPWSLANADGTMKKTNKAALASHIEGKVSPAEDIPHPKASIIDAMALIQKIHGENHTFEELSDNIFAQVLHAGQGSGRIDVVFDVYRKSSIKSAERSSRGEKEGLSFSQIRPGHKIKNWRRLLTNSDSKNNLARYLAKSWQDESRRQKLGDTSLFVTTDDRCTMINRNDCQPVDALRSIHEEADTRLLLHAKHAAETFDSLVIISDDTDVLVLCIGLCNQINAKLYVRRGTKARIRLVDVSKLVLALGSSMCTALLGLHPWTGCDSVSALSGQGKLKALKLLTGDEEFREAFSSLGKEWQVSEDLFNTIQKFTCQLYCRRTKITLVNELRYQMFRVKRGGIESGQLPPCENTLRQHTTRANYQSAIWRRSLENSPNIPEPTLGHGWIWSDDSTLSIQWMTCSPAPQAVLALMSCRCARTCQPTSCSCIMNNLKCTPACKLLTCNNMSDPDSDDADEEHSDLDDFSDSDDDQSE